MTMTRRWTATMAALVLSAAVVAGGDDKEATATTGAPDTTEATDDTVDTTGETVVETTAAADEPRIVEADNGSVEVPANPQKIATIGATSLVMIDMGVQPIAVTTLSDSLLALLPDDQKAKFDAATNVGGSGGEADLELLASLEPDLIMVAMPDSEWEPLADQFEAIAPTVFFSVRTEWKAVADGLAQAANLEDVVEAQKADFAAKIAEMQETYSAIIESTEFVQVDRGSYNDPGIFSILNRGCIEIAEADLGLTVVQATDGYQEQSFEQIGALEQYDVILYPVTEAGEPTESFAPVVETNLWQALPQVNDGHALGVFCPGNGAYGPVLRYLDSLDAALASLPA
jgi:iron complex transport system substrate-binding protein